VVADLSGDGVDDIAALSYPTVYLFNGPLAPGVHQDVDAEVTIPGFSGAVALAAADLDGDGGEDLVVGDYSDDGGVTLLLGPLAPDTTLDDAAAMVVGDHPSSVGISVAVGDLDGDPLPELVAGDHNYQPNADDGDAGAAFVFLDTPRGSVNTRGADVIVVGDNGGSYAGWITLAGTDLSGDGLGDLVLSAPYFGTSRARGGAVYVCTDLVLGVSSAPDCTATLRGEDGDIAGAAMGFAGDLNRDGLADLAVGSPPQIGGDGKIHLVHFPREGTVWLETSDAVITGDDEGLGFDSVRGIGDIDADGFDDLAFFGPYESRLSSTGSGVFRVAYGPFSGSMLARDSGLTLVNEQVHGGSLAEADFDLGDPDDDGIPDLVLGGGYSGLDQRGAVWSHSLDAR
jgi:hypothetical protein